MASKSRKPKKRTVLGALPDPFLDKDGNLIPLEMLDEESSEKAFFDVNGMPDVKFDAELAETLGEGHRLLKKPGK